MSTILVYTSPAKGHIYPLLPTLLELVARGHTVHVRTLVGEVERLCRLGLHVEPIAAPIEGRELDDWKAKNPLSAVAHTFTAWLERAEHEIGDLNAAIAATTPDVLYVDVNSWGALAAAEASKLPFAVFSPYFLNVRAPGRPPFGVGLAPATGFFGRLRDGIIRAVGAWTTRSYLAKLNVLRRRLGVAAIPSFENLTTPAHRVVTYTAEPFEYTHGGWPENVRLVGPGIWEPEASETAAPGPTAGTVTGPVTVPVTGPVTGSATGPADPRPLVLVTCSTEYQDDARIIEVALEALEHEPVRVIATSAAIDPARFRVPANATVVQFAAHGPLLARAAVVVCHGGMGITQKALASSVPVCVVGWGRDQLDVGRHVEIAQAGVSLPKGKLSVERLRSAVHATIAMRTGAAKIAEAFARSGGAAAAASELEALCAENVRRSA